MPPDQKASQSAAAELAAKLRDDRMQLANLWTRVQRFCTDRGWHAFLYVREDGDQFGRVGVCVEQAGGYYCRAFGNTTNEAIRGIAKQLDRDGFDG